MPEPKSKPENFLLNLICNVALPTLVLTKFSTERWLGPVWGLVVALAFPISYGLYDFAVRKKANTLSILGFVSVLLSVVLNHSSARAGSTGTMSSLKNIT